MNRPSSLATLSLFLLLSLGAIAGCRGGAVVTEDAATRPDVGTTDDTGETENDGGMSCMDDGDCDDGEECNGDETCSDGACAAGTEVLDGIACDSDGDETTEELCISGLCGPTRCGDGITNGTEVCDDGNDVVGDGCDACEYSCLTAEDCDDAFACNGVESCSADHACEAGTPLGDGASCGGLNVCLGNACVPPSCSASADCDDGDPCTGIETCVDTECQAGTSLDCDDDDACTVDTCGRTCRHALVDADRDGFSPTSLGACGTDCDDANARVNPDAIDACGDRVDNDCDGTVDESGVTTYYADCDSDGYATLRRTGIDACAPPAISMTGCAGRLGGWTTVAPTDAAHSDCNDGNGSVNPGQRAYQTTAISGAPSASDYDYDCDGDEERQITTAGACSGRGLLCELTEGWMDRTPACGARGVLITGCAGGALGCTARTSTRVQGCL